MVCFSLQAWAQSEMSLTQAMREALARYPAALTVQAQVSGAVAELDRAKAARWPTVSLGGSSYQLGTGGASKQSVTPQANYTVYAGGGIEAAVDRAEHQVRAAEGKVSSTQDEVTQQTAEAYLLWARSLEQKKLAAQNLKVLTEMSDDVRKIVAVDPGRAVDLSQANVRVNAAALILYQRDVDLIQARTRLSRYVGEGLPKQPTGLDDALGNLPTSLEEAWNFVSHDHPLLVQAMAQLEAAKAGVGVVRAQNRPKVDFTVSRQVNQFSLQATNLQQLSVNMPVFNGGAGEAAVRSAAEQVQAAQYVLDEQTLLVREKIGSAWADWALAQQRARLNQDQADAGQKLVESYQLQFRLARRTLLELLNVQSEAYGYASAAVQMHYDRRLARFKLMAALGTLARHLKEAP